MDSDRGPGAAPLLQYTGQPIIDVGIATIVAFCGRGTPEEISVDDLDRMIEYIDAHYTKGPLKKFLTSIYPNSAYVNPTMGDDKRKATMLRYLKGYATPIAEPIVPCTFCGQPSCEIAYRQHVPLSAGEGVINFGPNGRSGLPMCGGCLIASQAFPLGCAIRCEGRVLLVHSDNPELTQAFAAAFLADNRRFLSLADAADEKIGHPRTIVVSRLMGIDKERKEQDDLIGSLTAYHLTNFGQSPDLTIYHLPSRIVEFLRTVRGEQYRRAWQAIVAYGWAQPKRQKGAKGEKGGDDRQAEVHGQEAVGAKRNTVYEDLFAAQENAARFIRRHLLRGAVALADEAEAVDVERISRVSWALTDVFLRKVMGMDQNRIEAIRRCGDRLAEAIEADSDKGLLRDLYGAKHYNHLRNVLIKASGRRLRTDSPPVVTFDDFITIFEDGEDLPRVDWWLARDLLYIRVLDVLYTAGWFKKNAAVATEVLEEIEQATEPQEERTTRSA